MEEIKTEISLTESQKILLAAIRQEVHLAMSKALADERKRFDAIRFTREIAKIILTKLDKFLGD